MSFSRSEDISLLIAVDMPGWRLFVSLGTGTELGWSSTPTKGTESILGTVPILGAKVGFNVTKQYFGMLKYLSESTTSWEMLFALSRGAEQGQAKQGGRSSIRNIPGRSE